MKMITLNPNQAGGTRQEFFDRITADKNISS
jgi:hypothetical protein